MHVKPLRLDSSVPVVEGEWNGGKIENLSARTPDWKRRFADCCGALLSAVWLADKSVRLGCQGIFFKAALKANTEGRFVCFPFSVYRAEASQYFVMPLPISPLHTSEIIILSEYGSILSSVFAFIQQQSRMETI